MVKTKSLVVISLVACYIATNAQTINTSPLPTGETIIGNHLHAGAGNEVWTDAPSLYFNYRGTGGTTYFWNLGGGSGKPIMTLLNNGNVGINKLIPTDKLDVVGSVLIGDNYVNSNTTKLFLRNNAGKTWAISSGANAISEDVFSIYNWTENSTNPFFQINSNGNVGIGTIVPQNKLHVVEASQSEFYGTDNGMPTSNMVLDGSDNGRVVGKGPSLTFRMAANTDGSNSWAQARILASPDNTNNGDARGRLYLQVRDLYNPGVGGNWNWRTGLMISANGNVGIGTTNPDTKLTVNGKIHATEVIVDLAVPADYVFKPNYKLMPLPQVEQFVKKNSHLPEIPSASEITRNGLSMGEMQNKLLQKVEELTLYAIQQNKKIVEQEVDRKTLEKKYNALLEKVEILTKRIDKE